MWLVGSPCRAPLSRCAVCARYISQQSSSWHVECARDMVIASTPRRIRLSYPRATCECAMRGYWGGGGALSSLLTEAVAARPPSTALRCATLCRAVRSKDRGWFGVGAMRVLGMRAAARCRWPLVAPLDRRGGCVSILPCKGGGRHLDGIGGRAGGQPAAPLWRALSPQLSPLSTAQAC